MASLRLTFPEKDQPTVIALTGARLTIGRLPFNTIQIIDRTVSGFHAELINEHGHYRLHDRGSSNGTYVNGQKVSDYHLNEACTISFGTVEVQFNPADVATNEEAETYPSRGEVNAVRQENVEMKATVAALREEIDALRSAPTSSGENAAETVARADYERVVVEREALKEAQVRLEDEVNRMKTDLAILKRDRLNLQLAYDGAQRELEQLQRKVSGADDQPALAPVDAAAIVAAQADEVRIEVPKPAANAGPVAPPAVPKTEPLSKPAPSGKETAESETPAAPAAAVPGKPFTPPVPPSQPSLPKAPGTLGQPKPAGAPANSPVRSNPLPPKMNPLPPKSPAAPGAARPVPRPVASAGATEAPANGGGDPGSPTNVPTQRIKPLPPPRQIPQPTTKAGPKGTQKLSE